MTKKSIPKMSPRYWANKNKISLPIQEAVAKANSLDANKRLTESEYLRLVSAWLKMPVRGAS